MRLFHDAVAGPLSIGFSFLPVAALMLNLGEKRKFDMLNNNQVVGSVQVRTEFIPDVNPLQEHEDALRKLLTVNKLLKE